MAFSGPLRRSADGRYLLDGNSRPFMIWGDAGWCGFTQLSRAAWQAYLDDRKARGFNFVVVEFIERFFNSNSNPTLGTDLAGNTPFTTNLGTGRPDITTPRAAYWDEKDLRIQDAVDRDMGILASTTYLGSHAESSSLNQGWIYQFRDNGNSNMATYGAFIGNRYKNFPNIIHMVGGDMSQTSTPSGAEMTASDYDLMVNFTAALRAADPNHLITGHWNGTRHWTRAETTPGGHTAGDWNDLNLVYCQDPLNDENESAYGTAPPIPQFQGETAYQFNGMTTKDLRAVAWQATFSGSVAGFIQGNEGVWDFDSGKNPLNPNTGSYTTHLNDTGTVAFQRFILGMKRIGAVHTLVPDQGNVLFTSGRGTPGTADYVTAARSLDGARAAAYVRAGGTITIDASKMARPYVAYWFDPASGLTVPISGSMPFNNSGSKSFTTPAINVDGDADFGLILELPGLLPGGGPALGAGSRSSSRLL